MDYIDKAKEEIQKWEEEKPGFLEKVGSLVLRPVENVAEKLIPDAIQKGVASAIETCLSFLAKQGPRTFDIDAIGAEVAEIAARLGGGKNPDDNHRLEAADQRANHYWNWHISYAAAEGGATGAAGLPGLAADIPALFAILVRQIQEVGACYGYDPAAPEEREFLLHVLRAGCAGNVRVKMEFVVTLKQFEQHLLRVAWGQMNKELAAKELTQGALLAGLRQFAKTLGIQITKRKALQMIPVIGALVGASFNGLLARDVGKAAYMSYRRRWIRERGGPPDAPAVA